MNKILNNREYLLFIQYLEFKGLIDKKRNYNFWRNITINSSSLHPLYDIYKPKMKFLDLGCGAGNVLRYSSNIGYDVTGVEFDKNLTKYLGNYSYICQDITKLDKSYFNDFDVIYSYRPLKDTFKDFINIVIQNMKKNAYLLTPTFNVENKQVVDLGNYLYRKL